MSKAPITCMYCTDGDSGNGNNCGFCVEAICTACSGECLYCADNEYHTACNVCRLCDGKGTIRKPLDTQEDWDKSWGKTFDYIEKMQEEIILCEKDQKKIADLLKKWNKE